MIISFITILKSLFLFCFDYYLLLMLFYWYHRFMHMPIAGPLYKLHHIGHHKKKFPLKHLRDYEYGDEGGGGWFETGGELVFGIPLLIIEGLAFKFLSFYYFGIFIFATLFLIISGEIFHSSYHLNDDAKSHPESLYIHKLLVKRSYYRKFQLLHDIHHARTTTNFGFADYTMDKLFGTYCEDVPKYLQIERNTHPDADKY